MTKPRPGRVQEAIRQEVSKILQSEIKDPRLGFMTVTKVELTDDLRYARIYFSVLGEEKDKKLALKGLKSAKGYIRGILSDRINLRFMPDIEFKIDESLEHTRRIYGILEELKRESEDGTRDRGDKET